MNNIQQQLGLIARMDMLIRMQATGSPKQFASRLGISKTTLYRVLNTMKELEAPIRYDNTIQSFVYAEPVGFEFGFYKH